LPCRSSAALPTEKAIRILGCEANNLKDVDSNCRSACLRCDGRFRLGEIHIDVNDILYRALAQSLYRSMERPGAFRAIEGAAQIDKVIEIVRRPSPHAAIESRDVHGRLRADPRTLRHAARVTRARLQTRPLQFQCEGGRCEACQGDGLRRIEMNFLPDVYVTCEVCRARRYNSETLSVRYKGHSISDLLTCRSPTR